MHMPKSTIVAAIISAAMIATPAQAKDRDRDDSRHHHHKDDHTSGAAAAIAGALVLGAVVAAASKKKHHDDDRYYGRYRYDDDYRRFHDRPKVWSPAYGVTCYRKQRACYKYDHGYSAKWTRREFF